jgi:hypothetical protein
MDEKSDVDKKGDVKKKSFLARYYLWFIGLGVVGILSVIGAIMLFIIMFLILILVFL